MVQKTKMQAQNPLILRCHRVMEAFAKSDDERDFFLNRQEGFLLYADLDKSQEELDELNKELKAHADQYCPIPKLTFYEIKKVMEGFVTEKVYDIDTKEKLLDIIQSKEARENFLEFIYDHHSELEKWQQYYQERFRVRIIEWLRNNHFDFVFEEDLELTKSMVEKLKMNLFMPKVSKDIITQRKTLMAKAKTYYSNEALNPRPKRGRPPKQVAKVETEPQFSQDIYTTVPKSIKPFLFAPDYHGASMIFTFSGKYDSEEDLLAHRRQQIAGGASLELQSLQQKLAALRSLSGGWGDLQKDKGDRPHVFEVEKKSLLDHHEYEKEHEYPKEAKRSVKPAKAKAKASPAKSPEKPSVKQTSSKKTSPVKKQAPAKKIASDKKNLQKARLRPLPKKQKAEAKKKESAPKKKQTTLRHLRPAKKR